MGIPRVPGTQGMGRTVLVFQGLHYRVLETEGMPRRDMRIMVVNLDMSVESIVKQ